MMYLLDCEKVTQRLSVTALASNALTTGTKERQIPR